MNCDETEVDDEDHGDMELGLIIIITLILAQILL